MRWGRTPASGQGPAKSAPRCTPCRTAAGWMVRLSALEELLVGGCLLTVEDQAELGRTTARLGELAAHLAADDRQAQTVLLLAKNNNGELPPHLLALEHQVGAGRAAGGWGAWACRWRLGGVDLLAAACSSFCDCCGQPATCRDWSACSWRSARASLCSRCVRRRRAARTT